MSASRKLALFGDDQELHSNQPMNERLLRLIGKPRPTIGYVPEASSPERIAFQGKRDCYAGMGADLIAYFDEESQETELPALLQCNAIHLGGGNTFSFLYWLQKRGMIATLRRYVAAGGVLVGVSAGSILMTPDVRSASLCADVPDPRLVDHSALGLVDFRFWPHFDPSRALNEIEEQLIISLPNLYTCAGGAGIIVDGGTMEFFGTVQSCFRPPRVPTP